jgi:hypothetical protein
MIALTFKEQAEYIAPMDVKQRQVNDAVTEALLDCAEFLIEENLRNPQTGKFGTRSRSKYGFAPRNEKYERKKRFAKLVRNPKPGLKVQPDRPATDLRYTGRLRRFIQARGPGEYRKITTANANRIRLRIPIQVPGRKGGYMRAEQYEELSRWNDEEYRRMSRFFRARVAQKLGLAVPQGDQLWTRSAA